MELDLLLQRAVETGASDIHLKVGLPPAVRVDGVLQYLSELAPLGDADAESVLDAVTVGQPARRAHFDEHGDLDTAYSKSGLPRFRVNGFRQRGAISFAFRVIPTTIPGFDELGLPPGVAQLADQHRGLVLVTGATGSGKTTTLAAILDHINRTRHQHIVTIEDPIEVLHADHGCIVNQREVGLDTASFEQAIRRVLRQDPDVILIGELRDAESAQVALQAAQSGHLVLSTMHTIDAAETVGRFVEMFPSGKQDVTRATLASVLRGVLSQRLLPRAGGGRVAAVEVMVVNARIEDLIRENRGDEIPDAIGEGRFHQMQTMQTALVELCLAGVVEREDAAAAANNKHDFEIALDREEKARHASELLELERTAEETAEPEPEAGALRAEPAAAEPDRADPAEAAAPAEEPYPQLRVAQARP